MQESQVAQNQIGLKTMRSILPLPAPFADRAEPRRGDRSVRNTHCKPLQATGLFGLPADSFSSGSQVHASHCWISPQWHPAEEFPGPGRATKALVALAVLVALAAILLVIISVE